MNEDLFLDTFVGDIPQPFSSEREEVLQPNIPPNQYQAQPVQAQITAGAVLVLDCADSDTSATTNSPADYVLTGIAIQGVGIPGTSNCARTASISINGTIIREVRISTVTTTERFNSNEFIPLPNWELSAGSELKIDFGSPQANAESQAYVTLIGYLKK